MSDLWLRGAESKLVKQEEMERAVRLARTHGASAQLIVIPHRRAHVPLEQPEQSNAAVLDFFTKTAL